MATKQHAKVCRKRNRQCLFSGIDKTEPKNTLSGLSRGVRASVI